jgi:DNA repair protein RecO (recombination protein O)
MEWTDQGIVLGSRRHGESNAVVELMTRGRGRHAGMVRGGAGPRLRPVLQSGDTVTATWRARLDEHLGTYTVETLVSRSARVLASACALHGVALAAAHLRLLPERDPHPRLYDALVVLLDVIDDPTIAGPLMVRFEVALLEELGFGLDLGACAATGATGDLTHVSPKSGRAVSRAAALPYAPRLLPLPAFLSGEGAGIGPDDVAAGFRLTGFFLDRDVYGVRAAGEPDCRAAFRAAVSTVVRSAA